MTADEKYFDLLLPMLKKAHDAQRPQLEQAAQKIADCVTGGGMVYTFGTGHAHLLSEEIFYRAGGMARVCPMLDERLMLHVSAGESSAWERKEGVASEVLNRYPVKKGDVVIIFSNSGRNTAPVEMAMKVREKGAYAIALTNLTHSRSVTPRNPYGKRLFEVCDLVLDNMGVVGDAVVKTGTGAFVSPTSTAVGAALLQSIVARVEEITEQEGKRAEFFVSSNVDGGDAVNEKLIEKYRPIVKCL